MGELGGAREDGRTHGTGTINLSPDSHRANMTSKNAWLHPAVIATSSHVGGPASCLAPSKEGSIPSSPAAVPVVDVAPALVKCGANRYTCAISPATALRKSGSPKIGPYPALFGSAVHSTNAARNTSCGGSPGTPWERLSSGLSDVAAYEPAHACAFGMLVMRGDQRDGEDGQERHAYGGAMEAATLRERGNRGMRWFGGVE